MTSIRALKNIFMNRTKELREFFFAKYPFLTFQKHLQNTPNRKNSSFEMISCCLLNKGILSLPIITNKNPFIGLFNHTKIYGPGRIIKKLAGGQKLTLTLEHSVNSVSRCSTLLTSSD
jgi:hypothetical protein